MNQFIRCIDCGEGFMKTPFDQWPEYEYDRAHSSKSVRSMEKNDFQEFSAAHCGHQLEYLEIVENSFVSEEDYTEPVKTSYFKAVNREKEKFVIKQFREKIAERLKYQVTPGDYFLECLSIGIQSKEINKQLEVEFRLRPFTQDQISAFLNLYRRIVHKMDIKSLERIPEESAHPLEIFYKMDDISLFYLLRNCRNIFKGQEYPDIEGFIYRHKDDGVLLLKARYKIQITERVKTKKGAVSAVICVADKKVMKKE